MCGWELPRLDEVTEAVLAALAEVTDAVLAALAEVRPLAAR
jgi:hypothetical protein